MSIKRLGLRISLAVAAGMLATGCAGAAVVPLAGGGSVEVELPALPQINLFGSVEAAHSAGHAAQAIGQMTSYTYVSPYDLCEH